MDIVGFLLGFNPGSHDPFAAMMISGLMNRLYHYRKKLLLFGNPDDQPLEAFCQDLISSRLEGLIVIPPTSGALPEPLLQTGLPMVAVADRAPGTTSVVVDNEKGVFLLVEHLLMHGHRRVMYRKDLFGHESANNRYSNFLRAAQFVGIEVLDTLPADGSGAISREEERLLLARPSERPTAVAAWSDGYAFPVLKYCRLHGLNVPKDMAVAGFDGISGPLESGQRLTTVQTPWLRVAEKAVDLLMCKLKGETVPEETVLPVDLVIGDTT